MRKLKTLSTTSPLSTYLEFHTLICALSLEKTFLEIYQKLICKSKENGTSLISDKSGHLTRLLNISSEHSSNKSLKTAIETGDLINGAFMAGSSSPYLEKIEPVETIIQRIMKN